MQYIYSLKIDEVSLLNYESMKLLSRINVKFNNPGE